MLGAVRVSLQERKALTPTPQYGFSHRTQQQFFRSQGPRRVRKRRSAFWLESLQEASLFKGKCSSSEPRKSRKEKGGIPDCRKLLHFRVTAWKTVPNLHHNIARVPTKTFWLIARYINYILTSEDKLNLHIFLVVLMLFQGMDELRVKIKTLNTFSTKYDRRYIFNNFEFS